MSVNTQNALYLTVRGQMIRWMMVNPCSYCVVSLWNRNAN